MPEKKETPEEYKAWYEKNMERLLNKYNRVNFHGPNPDIQREYESFARAPFPPAAREEEINGVDLVLLDSTAAGCIQFFAASGFLDAQRTRALEGCVKELEKVVPLLIEDAAAYFGWLLALSREVIARAHQNS
jgi:hypothetical protein